MTHPFDTLRRAEAPPPGFTDRTVAAVVRDRRRQARVRAAGRAGVAVAVFAAFGLAAYTVRPAARPELASAALPPAVEPITAPPRPSPVNPLTAAQEALAGVTQRAGETAIAPARNLFSRQSESTPPPPAAEFETPTVTVAVLDPLTSTTRRAAGSFLNDLRQLSGRPVTRPERP